MSQDKGRAVVYGVRRPRPESTIATPFVVLEITSPNNGPYGRRGLEGSGLMTGGDISAPPDDQCEASGHRVWIILIQCFESEGRATLSVAKPYSWKQ